MINSINNIDDVAMTANLDLDLLRAFVAVAEARSFTRAAGRLHRVQSAVSMQIKRLEETVGARLFDRGRRSVGLTEAGEQLLGHARRMLALNAEALSELRQPAMVGTVRLGASDVASYLLPGVLARFARAYPRLQLEIRCERSWHLLDDLEAGALDLALVTQPCGRDTGQVVRREPLVWAAARGSLAYEKEPLPLAIFAQGCVYREAALAALDAAGRKWRIAYNSTNSAGLRAAVLAGLAVTLAPQSTLDGSLQALTAGLPPLPPLDVWLFRAPGALTAPAARLADDIVHAVATPAASAA